MESETAKCSHCRFLLFLQRLASGSLLITRYFFFLKSIRIFSKFTKLIILSHGNVFIVVFNRTHVHTSLKVEVDAFD